jgi:hypothetical protein
MNSHNNDVDIKEEKEGVRNTIWLCLCSAILLYDRIKIRLFETFGFIQIQMS